MSFTADTCTGVFIYGTCIPELSCKYFRRIPREYQCEFTMTAEDCGDEGAYIQYMQVFACKYNDDPYQIYYAGLSTIVIEMILLFIVLGTTADSFFCPSLCAVANMMGLSENLAGVTLLAFGNASPDLLTSLSAASYLGHELVSCQVLGGGLFVTALVAGLVLLNKQFYVLRYYFWRDTIFYVIAISWIFGICLTKSIPLWKTLVLILLYILYITVVCLESVVGRKMKKRDSERIGSVVREEEESNIFRPIRLSSMSEDEASFFTSTERESSTPMFTLHHTMQEGTPTHSPAHSAARSGVRSAARMPARSRIASRAARSIMHNRRESEDFAFGRSKEKSRFTLRKSYMPGFGAPGMSAPALSFRQPTFVAKEVVLPPPVIPRRRGVSVRGSWGGVVDQSIAAERISVLKAAGQDAQLEIERQGHPDTVAVEAEGEVLYVKEPGLFEDFVNEMNPIDDDDWAEASGCNKFMICLQAPIVYAFKLVIPVIDHCALNNGWCKMLNTIHCVTCPMFSCYTAIHGRDIAPDILYPAFLGVFLAGACLACIVYMTSEVNQAPPYHVAFAVSGFIISIQMIHNVASELVFLIDVIGNLLELSVATLAMTILAWGNSVGDLVANTALASAGYPRMAWAGCFGGPLTSSTLGAGVSLTLLVILNGGSDLTLEIRPRYTPLMTNVFFFLFLSLFSSFFIIPSLNFQCRRSYGTYLIIVYMMFISFSFLCEFGLIHPLRSESRKDLAGPMS